MNEKVNFCLTDLYSITADSYKDGCKPESLVDNELINNALRDGKGYNWLGGTRALIVFNSPHLINEIIDYTTQHWGNLYTTTTVYYSEDDSLELSSNLNEFPNVTLNYISDYSNGLSWKKNKIGWSSEQPIKIKRIMLTQESGNASFEFQVLGPLVHISETIKSTVLNAIKNHKLIQKHCLISNDAEQ